MAADFQTSYKAVMTIEGGYVNDPDDSGGETYKGVARKHFPLWSGWGIIDAAKKKVGFPGSLDKDPALPLMVAEFYKEQFWNKNRLSEFTSHSIAMELFDTGVNMGTVTAAMFLQRALNVLNRNGRDYPDVAVDGRIGITTISLVNKHKNPKTVYDVLNTLQGAKYIAICEANPVKEKYMYGWLTRCFED